jgi:hypothetical protein
VTLFTPPDQKIQKKITVERERYKGLRVKTVKPQKDEMMKRSSFETVESQLLKACSLGQDYTC